MRLLARAVFTLLLLGIVQTRASAQDDIPPPTVAEPATQPATQPAGTAPPGLSEKPRPLRQLEPPKRPEHIERIERHRPSGFWTSTRPAKGGAYRYRLLGIGVVLLLLTLAGMIWLIRRHTRDRQTAD